MTLAYSGRGPEHMGYLYEGGYIGSLLAWLCPANSGLALNRELNVVFENPTLWMQSWNPWGGVNGLYVYKGPNQDDPPIRQLVMADVIYAFWALPHEGENYNNLWLDGHVTKIPDRDRDMAFENLPPDWHTNGSGLGGGFGIYWNWVMEQTSGGG
jgi:prepilin-type processing-associated H-X9-DG protein